MSAPDAVVAQGGEYQLSGPLAERKQRYINKKRDTLMRLDT